MAAPRMGLPGLWRAIEAMPGGGSGEPADRIGRRVERIGARIPGAQGCYPQAIAAAALLRYHGHSADLVIGVRTRPFGAHAWVESDGVAVTGGAEAPDFREIWRGRA
ncbi:MAG: lasso peptide biosynthesis B2 protein [Alphaproteobacteria bacterium]|nr:lasso peptide biosynthesis B2 protein [Alphaproteobacteria bacterium]